MFMTNNLGQVDTVCCHNPYKAVCSCPGRKLNAKSVGTLGNRSRFSIAPREVL